MKKNLSFAAAAAAFIFALLPLSAQSALDYFRSGVDSQDREDWFGASESFQQALHANPVYGDAWFHLAQVTYELNDYNLTLSYLEQAEKYAKGKSDILNLRGMTFISLGRLKEARAVFNDVLAREPNNVDARFGLAELDLFSGRMDGARQYYQDALKRDTNSRKALLSLALLSAQMGKTDVAQNYLQQALRYHSGDAEVHYLAAYLDAQQGDYEEAERRARAAVQIKSSYTNAYRLLASILYAEKRYDDVNDICDYLIAQNRSTPSAWYLKGLSKYRKNDTEGAIAAWTTGLQIDPQDEIMRSALELLVCSTIPVEDSRRASWASFHSAKAKDFAKRYMAPEERYEYQRALRLNPQDTDARTAFAALLENEGLSEEYLNQLKFVQDQKNAKKADETSSGTASAKTAKPSYEDTRISDTVEAYDSLMKSSLASKWNVNPFYLDKTRYQIGLYCLKSKMQVVHPEAEEVTARLAADIFSGVSAASVLVQEDPVSGYGEAYRIARTNGCDYFIIMSIEETEREISLSADMYSARTGTVTAHLSTFRTGNDRIASAVRSFRSSVLNLLPVRGKVIARDGNDLLIDLGRTEGMVKDAQLAVIHEGAVMTADKGPGIIWDEKSVLGTLTLGAVGEEISSGALVQKGFYDRVNIGDEVVITSLPDKNTAAGSASASSAGGTAAAGQPAVSADTTPAAGANGQRILPQKKSETKSQPKFSPDELGLTKTPAFIDMIQSID